MKLKISSELYGSVEISDFRVINLDIDIDFNMSWFENSFCNCATETVVEQKQVYLNFPIRSVIISHLLLP